MLASGKKILEGVTGEFKAHTMTAIMGPSGCGKSTTMSALTNRIKDGGKVIGDIFINGKQRDVMTIQHVCGFVPQDDIMHRDLTVRENLRFYAKLKGDPNMSSIQASERSERALRKTRILATKCAKWLQTATSTTKLTLFHSIMRRGDLSPTKSLTFWDWLTCSTRRSGTN